MSHRSRIIPVLLVSRGGLTKTKQFRGGRYLGDPINACRIFSELAADELVLLDIDARSEGRSISPEMVTSIADEISMPLAVGGGISSMKHAEALISAGAERVVLATGACDDPYLIKEAADHFGSSAVTVCIDAKVVADGKCRVFTHRGTTDTGLAPELLAQCAEDHGAGEIIIQSIDRDGEMKGYDIRLIASVAQAVSIPVVALGGAGAYADLAAAVTAGNANAAAAGSLFVYRSRTNGVLINYPTAAEMRST